MSTKSDGYARDLGVRRVIHSKAKMLITATLEQNCDGNEDFEYE